MDYTDFVLLVSAPAFRIFQRLYVTQEQAGGKKVMT